MFLEAKIREVDITDGSRVQAGSEEHVNDLTRRIDELEVWRNRQKRGTEARANYSRLISRLKAERSMAIKRNKTVKG